QEPGTEMLTCATVPARARAVDNANGGSRRRSTVERMRTATAAAALGITLLVAGITSCAEEGGGPPVAPAPAPSGTPVFASDEEALAAAEAVYARFRKLADNVGHAGWRDPSSLSSVLTGE